METRRVRYLCPVFALASSARDTNHYDILDEREIASGLGDWPIAGDKLSESTASSFAQDLAERWKRGRLVGAEAETRA